VAKLIELNNHLTRTTGDGLPREVAEPLVLMMAPITPHVAEELWARMGHATSLAYEPFPVADPGLLVEDTVEYPVQVNGRVRGRVTVTADADATEVEKAALGDQKVVAALDGRTAKKVIVVPGRLVNIVV
jgi:leucyl-tRNA synthetase